MSTANVVPETWNLGVGHPWRLMRRTGARKLLRDAFVRMRYAGGFSHARSLAFLTSLLLVQGCIAMVGLASAIGDNRVSDGIVRMIRSAAPGPAGRLLTDAVAHAHRAGAEHRYTALVIGLIGSLVTGSTLLGQLERGLNRLYGVELDRPAALKYGLAFCLAVTTGALATVAFVAVAFGRAVGTEKNNHTLDSIWAVARWPVAFLFMFVATMALFRWCPRRQQPSWSWLSIGAGVAVLLWLAVTYVLGLTFRLSKTFGDTYGPLAGIVALQFWALLSTMGVVFGASTGAQLEAIRAGESRPRDEEKAEASEPEPVGSPSTVPETVSASEMEPRPAAIG